MKGKSNIKKLGKFAPIIGVILFIYIIIDIGAGEIANTFALIPIQYYILGFLPFLLILIIYPIKWGYICKKQKMDLGYFFLMKTYLIGLFYGTVTPAGIGWHVRIFNIRKKTKASIEKCLANSILDTQIGLLAVALVATIGTWYYIDYFPGLFPVMLLYFAVNVAAFVIFIKKSGGSRIFKIFIRPLIPNKYKGKLDQSVESLYEDIPRVRDLTVPFALHLLIWIISGIQVYLVAQVFLVNVPLLDFILINGIAMAATGILPISVGGLGVREGAFVYLFTTVYGVAPQIAFVISLSGFVVKMLMPALIGMVLSFRKDK